MWKLLRNQNKEILLLTLILRQNNELMKYFKCKTQHCLIANEELVLSSVSRTSSSGHLRVVAFWYTHNLYAWYISQILPSAPAEAHSSLYID